MFTSLSSACAHAGHSNERISTLGFAGDLRTSAMRSLHRGQCGCSRDASESPGVAGEVAKNAMSCSLLKGGTAAPSHRHRSDTPFGARTASIFLVEHQSATGRSAQFSQAPSGCLCAVRSCALPSRKSDGQCRSVPLSPLFAFEAFDTGQFLHLFRRNDRTSSSQFVFRLAALRVTSA